MVNWNGVFFISNYDEFPLDLKIVLGRSAKLELVRINLMTVYHESRF